ncbi:MAG: glycogen debranching N-terminal domain-containing protein, partial [Microbacterium sp.]
MTPAHDEASPPLQPLLDDAVIVLRAPTQVWSGRDGEIGTQPIDGVYHGDVRHVRALSVTCRDSPVEWISAAADGPSRVVFGGLLRGVDDATPDPKVRIVRDRRVADGELTETWTVRSRLAGPIDTALTLEVEPEFASLHDVKAGIASPQPFEVQTTDASATAHSGEQSFALTAGGAGVRAAGGRLRVEWPVRVEAGGEASVSFTLALHDATLVVHGAREPWAGTV